MFDLLEMIISSAKKDDDINKEDDVQAGDDNRLKESVTEEKENTAGSTAAKNNQMESESGNRTLKVWSILTVLTAAAIGTRLHGQDFPHTMAWDEAHFGKHASYYINQTYYFDLHPPIGKMLLAAAGYLTGYNGSYNFPFPGEDFEDHKILGMRQFCALMGASLVPLSFLTVLELSGSLTAASLAGGLILFDTGINTLCRYILLDSPLLFFMSTTLFANSKFRAYNNEYWRFGWFFWLLCTGISLGFVIGIKYVGVFVVLYVGVHTINDLYEMIGEPGLSMARFIGHFAARAVCLIVVPISIYLAGFYLHFAILYKTGPGEIYNPHTVRVGLVGSDFHNTTTAEFIAYQSKVMMQTGKVFAFYLHSHPKNYPSGTGLRQQQVTGYVHVDSNNFFIIKPWHGKAANTSLHLVRNGDLIILEHANTGRNLHAHKNPAIVSPQHYQVTGYGWQGKGDANDVWRVEVIGKQQGELVQPFKDKIRFRHYYLNCLLSSESDPLPRWGYFQYEVYCGKWNIEKDPKVVKGLSFWVITEAHHPSMPEVPASSFSLSFPEKFLTVQKYMLEANSQIGKIKGGEVKKDHPHPLIWPLNMACQHFSGKYDRENPRVVLLGNPLIWWLNVAMLIIYPFWLMAMRRSRTASASDGDGGATSAPQPSGVDFYTSANWMFFGWCLHYVPFFFMNRTLYIHHYYPALVFSCCLSGILLAQMVGHLRRSAQVLVQAVLWAGMMIGFQLFSPLVYGMTGDAAYQENSTYHHLRWFEQWVF